MNPEEKTNEKTNEKVNEKTNKVETNGQNKKEVDEKNLTKKQRAALTKKQQKAEYQLLKKQVLEFEESNFSFLIFIRQGGANFWQAGGHSAVFMEAKISERLKRPFIRREDTDFGVKSKLGVVYINSIRTIKTQLEELKIYPVVKKENSIRFKLDRPFTHEELKDMLGEEDRKKARVGKVFIPEHLMPTLDDEIKKLHKHVKTMTDGLKSPERDAYGTDMRKVTVEMVRLSTRIANGRMEKMEFLEAERNLLLDLDEFINVMISDGAYDVTRMAKLAEQYVRTGDEIEREVRKEVAKKVEESFKGKGKQEGGADENKKENS